MGASPDIATVFNTGGVSSPDKPGITFPWGGKEEIADFPVDFQRAIPKELTNNIS
jgi:hypothetical protein